MRSSWQPRWGGVIIGSVIALGALAISLGSYQAASQGGGTYVVLWGAALAGAALAIRSLTRTRGAIEDEARRRWGEAQADSFKRSMGLSKWEDERARQSAMAGQHLTEAEAAERIIAERVAERQAHDEEHRKRYRANAARAYAPIVTELKASMTSEDWEAAREGATAKARQSRLDALRDWLDHADLLPPGSTPPEHLNPASMPVAEDWQVARYLRPMTLNTEGVPYDRDGYGT